MRYFLSLSNSHNDGLYSSGVVYIDSSGAILDDSAVLVLNIYDEQRATNEQVSLDVIIATEQIDIISYFCDCESDEITFVFPTEYSDSMRVAKSIVDSRFYSDMSISIESKDSYYYDSIEQINQELKDEDVVFVFDHTEQRYRKVML
jgi:hypothetical protein